MNAVWSSLRYVGSFHTAWQIFQTQDIVKRGELFHPSGKLIIKIQEISDSEASGIPQNH